MVDAAIHVARTSPSYFKTMGVPVIAGRPFTEDDRQGTLPVAIVNQTMARQYWPGRDPLGRRLRVNDPGREQWLVVVGVVRDFRYYLQDPPFPAIYRPFAQSPGRGQAIVIRTSIPAGQVVDSVRNVIRGIDRTWPVRIAQLDDVIRRSEALVTGRFVIMVLGSLAGAAGLLAILGIYGVLAYTVAQRTREIGIRMALGAGMGSVVRGVLFRGLVMAGAGLCVGIIGSIGVASLLRSMLFGIQPTDPMTLAAAAMTLSFAAVIASYLPARRASKLQPTATLRFE
jgi:putative ABC transport system permease protein